MKIGLKTIIDAVTALDPAANSLVTSMRLHLKGGGRFSTDSVTTDHVMLWARNGENWLYVPHEEIVGFEVALDYAACAKEKIDTTVVAVIVWAQRH